MPTFQCTVCSTEFSLPQAVIDKYPGWTPKFCKEHSPKRTERKPGRRDSGNHRKAAPSQKNSRREENLTRSEVLARYTGGPDIGVFTDGSSIPNPGPGGWGVVWVESGEIIAERHGHSAHTTNNRMELRALIEAFKLLPEDAALTVFTDSRLCVDTITQWAPKWERQGWKKKTGEIKNLELIQDLLTLYRNHPECALEWIAAHSGNRWNEYADSLATAWNRDTL